MITKEKIRGLELMSFKEKLAIVIALRHNCNIIVIDRCT